MNLTEPMLRSLRSTGAWTRFIAVLLFILFALFVLICVAMGVVGVTLMNKPAGMIMFIAVGFYAVLALVTIIMAQKIWNFGSHCGRAAIHGSAEELARAQDQIFRF